LLVYSNSMAKKRSSVWSSIANIFSFLFGTLVWVIRSIYNLFAGLVRGAAVEVGKPKGGASFSELRPVAVVSGSAEKFEEWLLNSKSTVGLIIGARGSGKSALGLRILENIHAKTKRRVCAIGFGEGSLPGWVKVVTDVNEVRNGSFVLVDEGGIIFSSRESMSDANKLLSNLLIIARHKDLSILFISQNSANLEVNVIRQADYLMLRKPSLLQKDFERKKIREIYETAERSFRESRVNAGKATFIYSDEFQGIVENELPSFWSEGVSKGFKKFRVR
jgi:hypothetical protein